VGRYASSMPISLYLNLGKSYEDLGQCDDARRYYDLAAKNVADLPTDGYGAMVRRGISSGQRRTNASGRCDHTAPEG